MHDTTDMQSLQERECLYCFSGPNFLSTVLFYCQAPAAIDEQCLNLCVCPQCLKWGTNTQHSVLDWFIPMLYALHHRGRYRLTLTVPVTTIDALGHFETG